MSPLFHSQLTTTPTTYHHSAQVNKSHAITAIPNEILCCLDPNRVKMGALEVLDDVDAADVPSSEETWLS